MSVKNLEFTEEAGLRFDLTAIADHGDLHVRGVEIGASRGENIARSDGSNFLAVRFEMHLFLESLMKELISQQLLQLLLCWPFEVRRLSVHLMFF